MHRTAARLLLSLSTKLALTIVAAGHAPAAAAEAEPPPAPWSLPFLTAPPADVARAAVAHRGAVGERGYGCIRVEHDVRFEPDGRAVETMRSICHFTQAEAVQRDGVETIHYAPSVQERPAIRGRVITPDGQAVPFDTTSAVESGAHPTGDGAVLHDLRALRLPLPRLSVGAVVELERVVARHVGPVPVPDLRVPFPTGLSIERYAITFDAPASAGLSVGTNLPEGTFDTQTRGERVIHRLSAGNTGRVAEPAASGGASAPAAAAPKDLLAHASGWRNWQHAATWYGAQVDAQIAAGPAPADLLAGLPRAEGRGKNALDVLERLGERLAPRLRYVSIAVGASGLIPTPPAEALQRGFADCKDMATLLVSALRSLGFEAHVALLTTSGHAEVPDAPAILALFDHAIVAVRTPQGLRFVDLTRPDAPPEALPDAAAGRRVLVAAPTTRALTVTPMPTAAENLLRAEATLDLTNPREWVRRERMLARGQLVVPIRERMAKASNVVFHTMSRPSAESNGSCPRPARTSRCPCGMRFG
jgi:hypothetical protein